MSERYLRGIEIAEQLAAEKLEEFTTSRVAELAPDFARMAIEFPLGDIYGRDGLELSNRVILAIFLRATFGNSRARARGPTRGGVFVLVRRAAVVRDIGGFRALARDG